MCLGHFRSTTQAQYSTIFMFINTINILWFGIMTMIGIYMGVCARCNSEHL